MGVLADIYISTEDQAIKYDTSPGQFVDRAQYKGLTPLELSILWSIMRGAEWNVALMKEFPCLLVEEGGERLIHGLPSAMVAELAQSSPDRIESITAAWAATEELSCSPRDIRPTVDDLVRLSRQATETSRSVYLWNCV